MVEIKEKTSVLFVCMGNICRSPTAEGVFRKLVSEAGLDAEILTDSAGTHAYHSDEPADSTRLRLERAVPRQLQRLVRRRRPQLRFVRGLYRLEGVQTSP